MYFLSAAAAHCKENTKGLIELSSEKVAEA